jgi:DnaJ family protein C protein 2
MLALPDGDNGGNEIFSGYTFCEDLRRKIEPAGRVFEEWLLNRLRDEDIEEELKGENFDEEIIEEDKEEYEWEKEYKKNAKNFEVSFSGKDNYYAILGIEETFLTATVDEIRKAYKKLALIYHPDKNKENLSLEDQENVTSSTDAESLTNSESLSEEEKKKLEINRKWLKIKEAYETLLDPERKNKYDSTFEFDNTIPDEDLSYDEKSFFFNFGPCFLKNSIWSKKKPIPKLGDMNTPLEKVKQFYRFWTNFQSWREFSVEGEYNLEEASCRYEKRQMLKENKKMKSSMMKEEKTRMAKLVNLAYKNDPRIIYEEEKIRQEKEKIRQERIIQKQKEKEEEEERIKLMKKQYEENLKRQQEMLVKERLTLIEDIIKLSEELGLGLSQDDKFQIQLNGKIDNIKPIIKEVQEKASNEKKSILKNMLKSVFNLKFADDSKEVSNNVSLWKKEEINSLQKAVKKFPAGTKDRWEKIAEILKTKSTNQIIAMSHYLTTNPNIKIDSDIDLNQILKKKENSSSIINNPTIEKSSNNTVEKVNETLVTGSNQNLEEWTDEQQKALETALKKYPSSLPANERWTNIASEVPGKNKKQCVDRYKYLSSLISKKNK